MNRDEYTGRLRKMRYTRRRVHLATESDSKFYTRRLPTGELVIDAIRRSRSEAEAACPTGATLRWSGSMFAQFPQWQVRRLLLRTKRITA